MNFADFFKLCVAHPWAFVAIILDFAVVFVNGWTDGPNQIATAVTTRAIRPRAAVIMCGICNAIGAVLIGSLTMYISQLAGGDVSKTIASLVDFGNASIDAIMCAIACGLLAIVIFSTVCTFFGFPSSQSNCLIGGLTGSGLALMALGMGGSIGWSPWAKVLIGFFGSLILGFLLGYGFTLLIQRICKHMNKGSTTRFFNKGQIATSAVLSVMHGVQDGAKFIGVFILITAMLGANAGYGDTSSLLASMTGTWWIYVPVAVLLFAGTMMGGYNIIKTMGKGMATLKPYQAFATDIATSVGLLMATFFGLPVSTGNVKSLSIVGGGAARSVRRIKWDNVARLISWGVIAFPGSALIGFLTTMIFVWTC